MEQVSGQALELSDPSCVQSPRWNLCIKTGESFFLKFDILGSARAGTSTKLSKYRNIGKFIADGLPKTVVPRVPSAWYPRGTLVVPGSEFVVPWVPALNLTLVFVV